VLGPGVAGVLGLRVLHDRRQAIGRVLTLVRVDHGLLAARSLVRLGLAGARAREHDTGLVHVGDLVGVRAVRVYQGTPEGDRLRRAHLVAVVVGALAGAGHLTSALGSLLMVLDTAGDELDAAIDRVRLA